MQSFQLPDLYTPCPVRLNPHLEAAPVPSRASARATGITAAASGTAAGSSADPIRDEHDLGSHDSALLWIHRHLNACGPDLAAIADWHVWVFFFADHFLNNTAPTERARVAG
jgi:germacradienol/geosmin synthase